MDSYEIAPDHNLAVLRFAGEVHGEDLLATTRAFHADPRWSPGMDMIWDCRGVTKLVVLPTEMLEVTSLRTEDVAGRDASVVSRTLDETIARLYSMMARVKGKEAFVCHTVDEALEKLRKDPRAREVLHLK